MEKSSPQNFFFSFGLFFSLKNSIISLEAGYSIVSAKLSAIVSTIEPSEDALSMEEVVKLFSTAFEQIWAYLLCHKSLSQGSPLRPKRKNPLRPKSAL